VSIGADRSDLQDHLEENYSEELSLDEGISLALKTIAQSNDGELEAAGVDLATISTETEEFVEHTNEEIASHIAANDLESTEDPEE
jgi:Proteasome subunit.